MVFFGKRVSMRNTIRLFPKTLAYHSSWESSAATLTTALRRASSGLLAVSPVQALGPMTFNSTPACNSLPPCCCWPCWRPEGWHTFSAPPGAKTQFRSFFGECAMHRRTRLFYPWQTSQYGCHHRRRTGNDRTLLQPFIRQTCASGLFGTSIGRAA